jgi:hypothetical protein
MANEWYTADTVHILKAKLMGSWRNGDAKLTSATTQKTDQFLMGRLFEPIPTATAFPTGASFLNKYKTSTFMPGSWEEMLFFQTAMNLYPAMGACSTVDDSPSANLYTHTITLRTGQTPSNQGRHLERENITDAESERIDILGMMCQSSHIECSELNPIATQRNKWGCAYTKASSTDDITRSEADDIPFKWSDFTFPTFTYNSETIEAHIVGWGFDVINTIRFTGLDANGYFSVGKFIPTTMITTTLEIIPYGKNAFELLRTPLTTIGSRTGYATDLDLTVKCTRHTTNDYVQWAHDKMYCQPFVISSTKARAAHERYLLVLSQMDTGSLTITAVDDYDDDYYET